MVIFATGCAATSSPAFARMVGLDPELTWLATLATTLLVPLTAPPMALLLLGVDLSIGDRGVHGTARRCIVGLPMLLSLGLRRLLGPARLARWAEAVDGALVWLVVFYGFAVMDGLAARLGGGPGLGRAGGRGGLRRRFWAEPADARGLRRWAGRRRRRRG